MRLCEYNKLKCYKMKKILVFLFFLFFVCLNAYATQSKWTRVLFDSVHFAEKGNGIVVELANVKLSLANGADPNWINTQDEKTISTLSHFVEIISFSDDPNNTKKGVEVINLLFEHKAKIQYSDENILFFPIVFGKYEIVKILLEHGASATSWSNYKIGTNMTPIECATSKGYENIIGLLVSFGAEKIKEKDSVQFKFIEVARYGDLDSLKKLASKGIDVNRRNLDDETALLNALSGFYNMEQYSKVLYLLELGADVNLRGKGSCGAKLPLHEAIVMTSIYFNAENDMVKQQISKLILHELIKKGAYVSGRDDNEKTPLHLAAKYNNVEGAKILIEAGCKIADKDKDGKTPLDYAESAEMIKLLKSHETKEQ